ncbi:MAG: FecR domain-containing protein [Myxococcota bacterium]|nr:FecR domain-containing protein [Myxococcota bacterium]
MKHLVKECHRIIEIDLQRSQGSEISQDDSDFYKRHLATCEDCEQERALLDIASQDDNTGAAQPLDDLSRRRFVDCVLSRATEPAGFDDQTRDIIGFKNLGFGLRKRTWAGVAAASVAAVLFLWWLGAPASPPAPIDLGPKPEGQPAILGTFMLLSGDVYLGKQRAVLGDSFSLGDSMATESGRAVFNLPRGVVVSLNAHTKVALRQKGANALEVLLEQGQIQVSLDPTIERPGFGIATREGVINVKGTIFSVTAEDQVEVRVLRGEVEIADKIGRQRRVRSGSATRLGNTRTWTLSKMDKETLWKEVRSVDLLDADDTAVINIQSTPKGASVEIDSVAIGQTPVSAVVRSGYRELTIAVNAYQTARELIDIESGSVISRDFDFMNLQPREQAESQSTASKSTSTKASTLPKDLLRSARAARVQRDWQKAARIYDRLIRQFPDSDEARASLISAGEIHLKKLKHPKKALGHFNRYLATSKSGPLAQEALFAKATAYRAMGDRVSERTALRSFLKRFPRAIQTAEAEARLDHLASALD